jgi:succinoglycan biosynthesis transport protein ExoP
MTPGVTYLMVDGERSTDNPASRASRPGNFMRFDLLFGILRSRFWLIASVLLVTTLTAVTGSLLMSKRYSASTTIHIDVDTVDQVSGATVYSRETVRNNLATQIEIIKSDQVVGRVIKALALESDPDVQREWLEATEGKGEITSWLAPSLLRNLDAIASLDGTTITLTVEWGSAKRAADVANAFANAYKVAALELKTKPAEEYAARFTEQTKKYRDAVEVAQKNLSDFQRKSGIITSDERIDIENMRLQELSTELVRLQAQLSDSRSRRDAVSRGGDQAVPEVVQNVLIQTLTSELGRAEARLGQVASQYGENHPMRLAAVAEVEELRSRRRQEIARVKDGILSSNSINVQRERETAAALEAQKAKVLNLKSKRDELAVYQRELESAQRAFDLVARRLTETTVGASAGLSNVNILTPAVVPLLPTRPNILLNTVVGALLGLFLGLVAAFTLEAAQRPLRSAEDLLHYAGVPVLAVLPPSKSTRAQRLIGGTGPSMAPPSLRLGN